MRTAQSSLDGRCWYSLGVTDTHRLDSICIIKFIGLDASRFANLVDRIPNMRHRHQDALRNAPFHASTLLLRILCREHWSELWLEKLLDGRDAQYVASGLLRT